jgi:hypothetical protein
MSEFGGRRSEVGGRGSGIGDRVDRAIDLAVREMLDVEPPSGLRGRVLDRIESPRRGFAWIWIATPVAAAAAIVLAVLAPWRTPAPAVETSPSASIARVQPPPVVDPPPPPKGSGSSHQKATGTIPLPYSQPPTARRQPTRAVDEAVAVAAVAAADDNSTLIDSLAPIAPIVAAGTHPADIAPRDIAITPMAPIAQLQIAPLSPPERRN